MKTFPKTGAHIVVPWHADSGLQRRTWEYLSMMGKFGARNRWRHARQKFNQKRLYLDHCWESTSAVMAVSLFNFGRGYWDPKRLSVTHNVFQQPEDCQLKKKNLAHTLNFLENFIQARCPILFSTSYRFQNQLIISSSTAAFEMCQGYQIFLAGECQSIGYSAIVNSVRDLKIDTALLEANWFVSLWLL